MPAGAGANWVSDQRPLLTLTTIGASGTPKVARKIVDHPQVGPMTLDCDVLPVAAADLRIMIYSAEPGTEDAELLALLAVVGMQTLLTGP
jgi:hypothetical protein